MLRNSRLVALLLTVVAMIMVLGVSSAAGASKAAKGKHSTIKVLAILPETGPEASVSLATTKGAIEAVQKIWEKEHRGTKVKVTYCNDQGTSPGAISCVDQYGSSADVINGPPFQDEYLGAKPLIERLNKIDATGDPFMLPPAGSPLFQAIPPTPDAVSAALTYMKKQGWTRLGVLTTTDAIGTAAAGVILPAAKKTGFDVTSAVYADTAQNIVPQVSTILSGKPQAVFIWSAGPQVAVALKSLQAAGVHLPVMLNFASASRSLIKLAGSAVPSTLLFTATDSLDPSSVSNPARRRLVKEFTSAFKAKTGSGVSWDALAEADSMLVDLVAASHGTNGSQMAKYLEAGHVVKGMLATYKYSKSNHVGLKSDPINIMKWSGTGFVPAGK